MEAGQRRHAVPSLLYVPDGHPSQCVRLACGILPAAHGVQRLPPVLTSPGLLHWTQRVRLTSVWKPGSHVPHMVPLALYLP